MHNNNKDTIGIVIQTLKANHIRHVVLSPGGTNYAFVKAVQNDRDFICYSIVDERSAIYFAIGLYLQTGEAIATSCTSAQATRNYIPGLTEAFYKKAPILAITMCKHPRFTGQEYMQAPHQESLPDDCVKKSFVMPFISDDNSYLFACRIANEAVLELYHHCSGPVQLCIPKLDIPIGPIESKIKTIKRHNNATEIVDRINSKKVLIVIGEHRPFSADETTAIDNFCERVNAIVYANHLSNFHGKYCLRGNLALSCMSADSFKQNLCPDIIISIGGQTGDYPLYNILSKTALIGVQHWRISTDGDVVDTYDKLTDVFECSIKDFFSKQINLKQTSHDYYTAWENIVKKCNRDIEVPFSSVYAAQKLHNMIPEKSIIQFSILHSLRVWNLFPLSSSIQCFSNVGAFGIDGGLSTLIGQSMVTSSLCFMVIGDLAFYYDMNSLGIRHISSNVRILLINNNGGVEFKLGQGVNFEETNKYVSAANHFKTAKGWAITCGFEYIEARDQSSFNNGISRFLGNSERPILFELFVKDEDDVKAYDRIINSNKLFETHQSFKQGIKNSVKAIVGRK